MRLSLEGIGAVLQRDNEYTVIRRVVPGGPAHDDGRLEVGDRVVFVAQENEEPTDVIGWRLDDVVDLIRGPAGSLVKLGILPADSGLSGEVETIDIIRDEVKLEEQAAQKYIYDVKADDGSLTRLGVIDLPAFYLDFAARARRDPTTAAPLVTCGNSSSSSKKRTWMRWSSTCETMAVVRSAKRRH